MLCTTVFKEAGIRRDLTLIYAVSGVYSLGLSIAAVTLTFLAIDQGLGVAEIGLLSAASAVSQVLARLPLGWALRFLTDRFVLIAALVSLGLSMAFAIAIPGIVGLAIAQVAQGVSRAGFWTASQTHVVRASPSAARGLAHSNLVTSLFSLLGPLIAGWMASSDILLARWLVLGIAIVGLALALPLRRLPVFVPPKDPEAGKVSRRPAIQLASLGSIAGGAWMVISTTYIPLVLDGEHWDAASIGVVISLANLVQLVSTFFVARLARRWYAIVLALGAALSGLGIAALALAGIAPAVTVVALLAAGAGVGAVMTIGPALAAESVHPEERGHAIAITGSWRAAALLGVPLVVTAATLVAPVGAVLVVLGVVVGGPALVFGSSRRFRASQV